STLSGPIPVRCSYHPDVETLLRCSRCGKPICAKCGVRTPVGVRCPDCAGVAAQVLPLGIGGILRALGMGLFAAIPIGVLIGLAPAWGFYLGLALGFVAAEMVARSVPGRRGADMQVIAIAVVLLGLILSRFVIAGMYGFSVDDLDLASKAVQRALYLRPLPDLVFAAIPLIIAFFRFR
ncbi:MAG: B-box zinc finger protein, partial [Thermomicrobiales bacterium]